ncbi:hypothetical protein ACQEUU_37365 [Nonomuraea sp. CA-218870]|uniref:hypothetical protein n=1 Tax=Nonomuraea sp. CA-218870 TaxID=3239998 RepID=UPI003D8C2FF4
MKNIAIGLLIGIVLNLIAAAWLGELDILATQERVEAMWQNVVAVVTWNRAVTGSVLTLTALTFLGLSIRQEATSKRES